MWRRNYDARRRNCDALHQAIEDDRLGDIVFATWRFGGEVMSNHPYANLIETQCHGFDMLEHLCGPIEAVSTEMTDKTGKGYSTLVLALRFASGAVGSYDSSSAYQGAHLLEVNGTAGRVTIEDTVRRYAFQPHGVEMGDVWQAGYFNDDDRAFHRTFDAHTDALLSAFKASLKPPIHARAGHRALALAHAAIASFETGRRVRVDAGG